MLVLLGARGSVLFTAHGHRGQPAAGRDRRGPAARAFDSRGYGRVARPVVRQLCSMPHDRDRGGDDRNPIAFAPLLLVALGPDSVPRLDELSIDARVFAFAILVASSMMLIFASGQAIHAARQDPQDGLRADGRSATSGSGRRRIRAVLTIGEVALSVALLIGAGLFMRSFARCSRWIPGFSVSGLMTARVKPSGQRVSKRGVAPGFYERFLEDLRGRAGIEAAAISSGPPLSGDFTGVPRALLPTQTNAKRIGGMAPGRPGIFAALGIPIRGREFTMQDTIDGPPVAIISAALAKKYFPHDDPLGRKLLMRSFTEHPHTIVGIAGDVRTLGLDEDAGFVFYGSATQYAGWNPMSLVWRSPVRSAETVRASLRSIDPNVPISTIESMDTLIDRSMGPRRFNLYLLGAFAAVSLALAAIGLFGVMAYLVAQRTREIGVRLALGATRGEVFRLILGRGMALAAIGATGGVGAALWLTRVMEALLFSVLGGSITFVAAGRVDWRGGLACYLPARRAMKVDRCGSRGTKPLQCSSRVTIDVIHHPDVARTVRPGERRRRAEIRCRDAAYGEIVRTRPGVSNRVSGNGPPIGIQRSGSNLTAQMLKYGEPWSR